MRRIAAPQAGGPLRPTRPARARVRRDGISDGSGAGAAAGAAYQGAYSPDHAFRFGLQRVLDGLGVMIDGRDR